MNKLYNHYLDSYNKEVLQAAEQKGHEYALDFNMYILIHVLQDHNIEIHEAHKVKELMLNLLDMGEDDLIEAFAAGYEAAVKICFDDRAAGSCTH